MGSSSALTAAIGVLVTGCIDAIVVTALGGLLTSDPAVVPVGIKGFGGEDMRGAGPGKGWGSPPIKG